MENLGSLGVVAVVQGAVLVLEHLGSGERVALGRVVVDGMVEDGWVEGDRVVGVFRVAEDGVADPHPRCLVIAEGEVHSVVRGAHGG